MHAAAVSAAGDVIASAGDGFIGLWSRSLGRPIGVLPGHSKRVRSLAFNRAGRPLVGYIDRGRRAMPERSAVRRTG